MRTVQVDDLLRTVMTRGDVARYLQRSISTVRRLEGVELHPQKIGNAFVFDSKEVEALARKLGGNKSPIAAKQGELAARAFELFDKDTPFREIVKALKVKPEIVKQWYIDWRTPIEEHYARVMADKKLRQQIKGQRALERAAELERKQDKHDLKKFEKEMAIINKQLKGGKK